MRPELNDLIFELLDRDGFKLCFCVCDDPHLQGALADEAFNELHGRGVPVCRLHADGSDLVQRLLTATSQGRVTFV